MRLAVLALVFATPPAFGHKLMAAVTPLADPPRLRVEARYDDGTPADGATATVRADGAEVGRTTLDRDGAGELSRPAGRWAVTVDDGAGHRATASGEGEVPVATTGSNRWLMVAAGLAVIGGWTLWRRQRAGR